MTSFTPSLHAIYKQSRANHHSGTDAPKKLQEQRERVAVAMTGLVLQHEESFLREFLCHVCGHKSKATESWDVKLEIPDCGDMAIRSEQTVFIVEFKIEADLQPHQLPDAKGGYCDEIDRQYSDVNHRRYLVVQNNQPDGTYDERAYRTWHDVRKAVLAAPSQCTKDLSESLAKLNIPAFSSGKTAQMKVSQHASAAAKVFRLLENVAQGAFGFKRTRWDVSDDDDYIGLSIQKSKDLEAAEEIIQPYSNELAWFGYEGTQLSVWFYCSEGAVRQVRSRLEKMWPNSVIIEDTNVGVRMNAEDILADQGFFEKTLGVIFTPKVGK